MKQRIAHITALVKRAKACDTGEYDQELTMAYRWGQCDALLQEALYLLEQAEREGER